MRHSSKAGNTLTIVGISANSLEKPLEKSGFELEGKSAKHYVILAAAILFVLISLVALIICIVERGLRRKWAWILFIIFGFGQLTLNWSTGETSFSLLSIHLFSAGTTADLYGAWMLFVALPVGAVWYLVRRFLNHPPPDRSDSV